MHCAKIIMQTVLIACFSLWGMHITANDYARNPYVDPGLWDELTPYFFPADFPEKELFDKIFAKRRVLKSVKEMHKAEFLVITDPKDKIIVARHHKIPDFLIKVYLDTSPTHEWYWWKKRIDGANTIREAIERHGYGSIMKVPRKWMYPLPAEPSPKDKEGIYRKDFVLVVEDMHILSWKKNRKAYKKRITKEHLKALYTLINECGLLDSVYADNIPFCKDGKIAFLDTEHSLNEPPFPMTHVGQYLNDEMVGYWEQLLNGNSID
jgi:hypothetical protein